MKYETSLKPGIYNFGIVSYMIDGDDSDMPVNLMQEDIDSIIEFLVDAGEDIALFGAFREYNEELDDRIYDQAIEEGYTDAGDEFGITFPEEIVKEARNIRLEL